MKTAAIIQARIRSERLPGKVLYELGGRPLITFMLERVRRAQGIDAVVLATGDDPSNQALLGIARECDVVVFQGPEDDVLARFAAAADAVDADRIVRLTGDCPFIDPGILKNLLVMQENEGLDYCCNMLPPPDPIPLL